MTMFMLYQASWGLYNLWLKKSRVAWSAVFALVAWAAISLW